MRLNIKSFLGIMFVLLYILSVSQPVFASEEMPTVNVAMSEDESIIVERILYTALKRIDYQMVTKTAGMRTMVNDVNYGDSAIVPAQTIGLDEEYPNLIRVPVPISYVEVNAYTQSDMPYEFSDWSELKGLRLSHCWKNLFVTRNVPKAEASEVITLNEYEDLWDSLLANETDVAVIPNLTGFVRIVPEGIKQAGVIQREPRYTYVNKDYDYLVPLLTDAYQKMTDDGTMEQIRNSQQVGDKQVVLHISSYSSRVEWERSEIEAIRKALELNTEIEYQNLNLNARQVPNKSNMNAIIANTIRTNFIERNPDVIIVSDNDALEFVLNNYYMLFPKVPVVFCGINDFDISMLHGFEEYVTGVSESESVHETVTEMLRLYPETQRIYFLNDYTDSGLKWRDSLEMALNAYDFPVEFEFNENKPFDEILEDIRGFDSNTLVLIGTYFSDGGNTFYMEQETQEAVSTASKMPVFCQSSSFIGYGTFGGMVSVGETQGQIAGTMARDILMGKAPSEISIIIDSKPLNQWQFDYTVAERFGIDIRDLPAGHTILNRNIPIWESNPLEFRLALMAIIFSFVIIVVLTVFLRLMRKKNTNLIEIQSHLHSAEEFNEKLAGIADKEKEANMLKSLFLSNMSHEIRTPVNAITGMTLIGKSSTDMKRKDYAFEKIENASQHLLGVINDILDMSKIEANKFELSNIEFNFEKMLQKIVNIINFRVDEKRQHFSVLLDKDIPRSLIGDDQRLTQVITNLLSNAVKFTPEEGLIRLDTRLINKEDDICEIQIEVTDTGIGIDPGRRSRLFRAFEQADGNTSRNYGGTGLGLAISKNIVELMGGSIWVESEFGKGSKFAFTVKLKTGSEENLYPLDSVANRKDIRVLVVDDEIETREYFASIAEQLKISCDTTASGAEAMKLIDTNGSYDIYFVDWNMPIMNGIELSREIKARVTDKSVIIMISATEWYIIEEDAKTAGVDKFLPKPLFPSSVSDCINEYLGQHIILETADKNDEIVSLKGYRILLAEDVAINREIVLTLLEPTQSTVDCATNGIEAVQMFNDMPDCYDIILMDLQMPEMDGLEATRHIRSLGFPKAAEIPIIAMTANVFKEDIERCREAGMNDHLGKPLDFDEMMSKIKQYLQFRA